jgi:hypothetical protein
MISLQNLIVYKGKDRPKPLEGLAITTWMDQFYSTTTTAVTKTTKKTKMIMIMIIPMMTITKEAITIKVI